MRFAVVACAGCRRFSLVKNKLLPPLQFHKWGRVGIIGEMERSWQEQPLVPNHFSEVQCNELRVKFYLQSDLFSKATQIIQQFPFNEQMQVELLGFHLRNHANQQAEACLSLLTRKYSSICILEECIIRLLENNQFLQAQKIFLVKIGNLGGSLRVTKAFLRYYFDKLLFEQALELEMQVQQAKVPVDLEYWNLLLAGYAKQGKLERMQEIAQKLASYALEFDISTYNAFLFYYASRQPNEQLVLDKCAEILHKVHSKALAFDEWTFEILIDKMIRFYNYDQITALFAQLKDSERLFSLQTLHALSCKFIKHSLDFGIGLLIDYCLHFGICVNMKIRNLWIDYLLSRHEFGAALQQFAAALEHDCAVNGETFRILLHHFAANFQIEGCRVLLEEMHLRGMQITNEHHAACMSAFYFVADAAVNPALVRALPTDESFQSFRQCQRWEVLDFKLLRKTYQQAFNLTSEPPVTIDVYNELLLTALRLKQFPEFALLYDKIIASPTITPNVLTFLLKIKTLILAHEDQAAREMLKEMQQAGIEPPMLAYAYIFHYYCRKADTDAAEQLLHEFEVANSFRINFVFYSSLLYAYVRKGNWMKVISTFNRLEAKYMISDTETLNYLIESTFRIGDPQEAIRYFALMKDQKIPRNWYTYSIMIDNLLRQETPDHLAYIYTEILPDCTGVGNAISAASFDRLFLYHFHRSNYNAIEDLAQLMIQYAVRFNYTSVAFLSICLKNLVHKGAIERVTAILYKICTDFAPLNAYIEELFEQVIGWLEGAEVGGQEEALEAIRLLRSAYLEGQLLKGPANALISSGYSTREE